MQGDKRIRLALIYGGRGVESEVSISGVEHICSLMDDDTYSTTKVFIDKNGRWLIDGCEAFPFKGGFYCPENQRHHSIDVAFPLLHGDFGEDGVVQGALESAMIAYVGCDVSAGAVCRDKALVKTIAASLGIPTLNFLLLLKSEGVDYAVRQCEREIGYPVFIKPTRLGSSVGVGCADNRLRLEELIQKAFSLSTRILAEPFLSDKRELECGYLRAESKEIFTNPGEILINGLYGYEEKYHDCQVGVAIRADVPPKVALDIREYSRRLVRALGVRDLSRIDFFLSGDKLYFNEINTMPGFTSGSLYPKMIEGVGIGQRDLILTLVRRAIART